jgi:hypothetical protein
MLLPLRRNHFFRSFWCFEHMTKITAKDIKYLDLDSVNKMPFVTWFYDHEYGDRISLTSLDLSYWNTYNVGINFNNPFEFLMSYYFINMHNYGTKNFRTDNMDHAHFSLVTASSPIYFNKDWKTAQLTELWMDENPHWNMYNLYNSNRNKQDRHI